MYAIYDEMKEKLAKHRGIWKNESTFRITFLQGKLNLIHEKDVMKPLSRQKEMVKDDKALSVTL